MSINSANDASSRPAPSTARTARPTPASAPVPVAPQRPAAPVDRVQVNSNQPRERGANGQHLQGLAQNFGPETRHVTAETWRRGQGNRAPSTAEGYLRGQGHSLRDIYRRNENGRTMIDQFNQANGISQTNPLRAGRSYQVPASAGRHNQDVAALRAAVPRAEQQDARFHQEERSRPAAPVSAPSAPPAPAPQATPELSPQLRPGRYLGMTPRQRVLEGNGGRLLAPGQVPDTDR